MGCLSVALWVSGNLREGQSSIQLLYQQNIIFINPTSISGGIISINATYIKQEFFAWIQLLFQLRKPHFHQQNIYSAWINRYVSFWHWVFGHCCFEIVQVKVELVKKSHYNRNKSWIHLSKKCKELFLNVCCIDENNPSLIEIAAGLKQWIFIHTCRCSVDENGAASNSSWIDETNALLK